MAEETNLKQGSIAIKNKLMRGATGVSNGKQRESDYFQFEHEETTTNLTTKVSNF